MTYRVLQPHYEKTGEVTQTPEGPMRWHRVIYTELGTATDMADALRKFPRNVCNGYSPVLEPIGRLH